MTRDWNRENLILARRKAGETFTSIAADHGMTRQRAHAIWKRNQPPGTVGNTTVNAAGEHPPIPSEAT